MKRFTTLFIVLALVVTAITPAFAGKGDAKKSNFKVETIVAQQANETESSIIPAPPKTPVRKLNAVALAGLYSVGLLNPGPPYLGNYATLGEAMAALQAGGVTGPTTFEFTDAAYVDTGGTIGGYAGQGPANPVVFQRSSLAPPTTYIIISGGVTTRDAGILINGANSVTWDGGSGSPYVAFGPRPLTIEIDTLFSTRRNVFKITNGSENIHLKDMELYAWRKWTGSSTPFAVVNGFSTASSGPAKNLLMQNLGVHRGANGLNFGAPNPVVARDTNTTIEGCTSGGSGTSAVTIGIGMSGTVNGIIRDNDINGVLTQGATPTAFTPYGMQFFGGMENLMVERNKIHNLERASGSGGAYGIVLSGSATAASDNNTFRNNMIYDLRYLGVRSGNFQCVIGIYDGTSGTMGKMHIYNNTIHLTGALGPQTFSPWNANVLVSLSAAGATDTTYWVNNIYSIEIASGFNFGDFTDLKYGDYNLFWYNNAGGGLGIFTSDLAAWQGYYGFDLNSIDRTADGISPQLVGPLDPHVNTALGLHSDAEDNGTAYGGLADDFDMQARPQGAGIDIGADEFVGNPYAHDAAAIKIYTPGASGMPAGKTGVQPYVRIYNNGSTAENITVTVTVNCVPPAVSSANFFVNQFDFANVVLPALPPIPLTGAYTVDLQVNVALDGDLSNDLESSVTNVLPKVTPPYFTNFEDGGELGWMTDGGDWVLGTPAKTTIVGPASAPNSWTTKTSGNYSDNHNASVYSPFFDLTAVANPIVKFDHQFASEGAWDGGVVDYSLDYGGTWNRLGTLADPKGIHWYNDGSGTVQVGAPAWSGSSNGEYLDTAYTHSELYAKGIGSQDQVQFRFRFASDGNTNDEGWSFDNFAVNSAPSLSGDVWNDANNNGTFDGGEPVFGGATVTLIRGTDTTVVTTDGSGHYTVDNLFEGNYNITCSVVFGMNTIPGGTGEYNIALVKNQNVVANFAYYNPATISGEVWDDVNHNQLKDGTEGGLAGATLTLNPGGAQFTTLANGLWSFTVNDPGTYTVTQTAAPVGYVQIFPKVGGYTHAVTYGSAVTGDQFGDAAAATVLEFRTGSMNDWATAVDAKGKSKEIKCKPYAVDFKFNVVAPTAVDTVNGVTGVEVKLGQISDGVLYRGKDKTDTMMVFAATKVVSYTGAITPGETLQIDGHGTKGKPVKPSYKFFVTIGGKAKKLSGKVTEFKLNAPRLPMPNLHNVGVQMAEQQLFPFTIGCTSGIGSILLDKYKTVMTSLNKKGVLHTGAETCLVQYGGKPIKKQLKGYDAVKGNNRLFAEVLTLALNLGASARDKFPTGLGGLIYDDQANPGPFNGKSIDTIYAQANAYLCNCDTLIKPGATSADYYNVVKKINDAFAGVVDTVTWSCGKLQLTGVKELKDVPYLRALPGYVQPATRFAYVPKPQVPANFDLAQNYPNPFNPTTTIQFSIPQEGLVTMKIYNMLGQEVASLLDNVQFDEGENEVDFDAASLPSGVYFYRLSVQSVDDEGTVLGQAFTQVKKMMLVK